MSYPNPSKGSIPLPEKTIFLLGPSGSGKTVISQKLASKFGIDVFDTDKSIVERVNLPSVTDVFALYGEDYFRNLEKDLILEILENKKFRIVSTGGGLPAIPGMMELMNKNDITVYLQASIESLWARLNFDTELEDRPLLKDGGKDALNKLFKKRENFYLKSKIVLKTNGFTVDTVTQMLYDKILKLRGTV